MGKCLKLNNLLCTKVTVIASIYHLPKEKMYRGMKKIGKHLRECCLSIYKIQTSLLFNKQYIDIRPTFPAMSKWKS